MARLSLVVPILVALAGACGGGGSAGDGGASLDGGAASDGGGSVDGGARDGGAPGPVDNRPLFQQFIGSLEHEADPAAQRTLIDRFITSVQGQGGFPIRGGDDVTFFFRGRVESDAPYVMGSFNAWDARALRMFNINNSDVWVASATVGGTTRFEYQYVDGTRGFADPLNPLVSADTPSTPVRGELRSVTLMPAHVATAGVLRLEADSVALHDRYVFLPASYLRGQGTPYPALYVQDGFDAIAEGRLHAVAEATMSARAIPDLVVVFLDVTPDRRTLDYTIGPATGGNDYVDDLSARVVPALERRYRLASSDRAMAGVSYGGLISLHAARRKPGFWARFGALSPAVDWDSSRLVSDYRDGAAVAGRFYLEWSEGDPSANACAALADAMAAHAYDAASVADADPTPADWADFAERFPALLRSLYGTTTTGDGGVLDGGAHDGGH